jgi:sugar lactone lactonase YvrE
MRAEQITDPVTYHGEGPVWSASWGGLRWVDMLAGDVLALGPDGGVTRRHVGSIAAALRPRSVGGAVIAVERGFALQDAGGSLRTLPEVWRDPSLRMNEGSCDPQGRFYCGSMSYQRVRGAGALYRLDPDLSVRNVLTGVTISNGLEWSPDGSLVYYNDTPTRRVDVFDFDPETGLSDRRPFVVLDEERPDGLTVDAQGGVWVAFNGQGRVHRYTSGGRLSEVVEVGAAKTTACCLGGSNLDRLFITTSRENLPDGADPLAGALFVADVGVAGLPARPFAG